MKTISCHCRRYDRVHQRRIRLWLKAITLFARGLPQPLWGLVITFLLVFFSFNLFAQSQHLTILHFNDLHGHIEAECVKKKCEGGAARLAYSIRKIEEENDAKGWKTILLFGGDAFISTPISSEFKGEAEFKVLDALGVDAMVLGNHDFAYSLSVLKKRMDESNTSVITANIREKDTKKLLTQPTKSLMFSPNGPFIVIVGLTTEPDHRTGLVFYDPLKTAKKYTKLSKHNFLIALTHLGAKLDIKLAEETKGFNVIIGGHDHVKPGEYCRTVKKIPVCQTPENGEYLGRLDFEIEGKKVKFVGSELIPIEKETGEDAGVASIVNEYSKRLTVRYNRVIGIALTNIPSVRGEESALGDLVADAMRAVAKTDIGFINSGGVRTSIKKGVITSGKMAEVFPFDNFIVKFNLNGAEIQKIMDFSVSRGGESFLQVSGLTFRIESKKASDIKIGDEPLDPDKSYTCSTVDFIANGGDGYAMLKSKQTESLNILARDALIEYIRGKKRVASSPLNRISQ